MAENTNYWFALIAASPAPEHEEAANVGVVVGNGTTAQLGYVPGLPRLCGLAARDEAAIYESLLSTVTDSVRRGMDIADLRTMLGPQLRVMRQRALFRPPSDELLGQLCARYLERPRVEAGSEVERALAERSDVALTHALDRAGISLGMDVQAHVRPKKLYGSRLDRYVGYKVPALARAVRGPHRDLLIDSVRVESGVLGRPLRQIVGRVGQAFWAYDRQLREPIRQVSGREIQLVGVLHPGVALDDPDALQAREYVKHVWSQDAIVIDGNAQDVAAELRAHIAWLREG